MFQSCPLEIGYAMYPEEVQWSGFHVCWVVNSFFITLRSPFLRVLSTTGSTLESLKSFITHIWGLRCFSNRKVLTSHAQNPDSHPKNCGSSYGETYLQSLYSGSRGNMTINLSNPWLCSEFEASRSYMTPHIKSKNGNSCFLVISEILKYFLALKARLWLPMWCHVGSHYFKTQLLGLKRWLSVLEHKFLL